MKRNAPETCVRCISSISREHSLGNKGGVASAYPNCTSKGVKEEEVECLYCRDLYGAGGVEPESSILIANKILELEREMDKLSDELKHAYFVALEQEVKQRTNYVRSEKFLVAFLRAESYDASKAAIRLAKFFKCKLELFGPEKLPRPIRQGDLDEDDMKVLLSGFCHFDVDCGGRVFFFLQRERLQSLGLLKEQNMKNISRACFYQGMCAIESNVQSQKRGFVAIRWNLNCTQSLKEYRITFLSFIKMNAQAMPMKVLVIHNYYNNPIESTCSSWAMAVVPKYTPSYLRSYYGTSASRCLKELSKYGINVESLPITQDGKFNLETHQMRIQQLRDTEFFAVLKTESEDIYNEIGYDSVNAQATKITAPEPLKLPLNKNENNIIAGNSSDKDNNVAGASVFKSVAEFEKFSLKLMEVLNRSSTADAIWWTRAGSAFAIDKDKFSGKILSKEFHGIKFASFLRRLSRWGFQRLHNKGETEEGVNCSAMEYQHRLFQRDSPKLLKNWDMIQDEPSKKDKLPMKLMKVLNSNSAPDAIWWVCNGTAVAFDKNRFPLDVLDIFFEGLKLDSFYRMLRKWGFKRLSDQEESIDNAFVYQHSLFQEDSPLSADLMENWAYLEGLARKLSTPKQGCQNKGDNWPKKLYRILSCNKNGNAIWWLESGNAFAINIVEFPRDVLTKEYDGVKFSSFRRSLKRWGFEKVKTDSSVRNVYCFHHPSFRKDSPELLDKWPTKDNKPEQKCCDDYHRTTKTFEAKDTTPTTNFAQNKGNVIANLEVSNNNCTGGHVRNGKTALDITASTSSIGTANSIGETQREVVFTKYPGMETKLAGQYLGDVLLAHAVSPDPTTVLAGENASEELAFANEGNGVLFDALNTGLIQQASSKYAAFKKSNAPDFREIDDEGMYSNTMTSRPDSIGLIGHNAGELAFDNACAAARPDAAYLELQQAAHNLRANNLCPESLQQQPPNNLVSQMHSYNTSDSYFTQQQQPQFTTSSSQNSIHNHAATISATIAQQATLLPQGSALDINHMMQSAHNRLQERQSHFGNSTHSFNWIPAGINQGPEAPSNSTSATHCEDQTSNIGNGTTMPLSTYQAICNALTNNKQAKPFQTQFKRQDDLSITLGYRNRS